MLHRNTVTGHGASRDSLRDYLISEFWIRPGCDWDALHGVGDALSLRESQLWRGFWMDQQAF